MYARRVLPEFLALLAERAARSSAAIGGSTIKALLDSAAATAGIVATAPGTTADEAWDDAWLLQSGLYDRLLAARRARFGPTPNRVPHRGYTPMRCVWLPRHCSPRTPRQSILGARLACG